MQRRILSGQGKTLLLIVSLAFNLGLCLAMAVQTPGSREPTRRWRDGKRHRPRLAEMLNLSAEQSVALATSRDELFGQIRPLKRKLSEEGETLAGLLTASELDTDAVSGQVEQVAVVRNEMQWLMVQHILKIREMLEPEQLESLKEFAGRVLSHSEQRGWRGGRRPRHDEGDPPGPEIP